MTEKKLKYAWVCGEKYQGRVLEFLMDIDEIMIPCISERMNLEEYALKLSKRAETLFVSIGDSDVASCSVYCNRDVAFISSIAVKKEFARQSVGMNMMHEVKAYVCYKGCGKIRLEVYEKNYGAIAYYRKNGFFCESRNGQWIIMECFI